MSSYLARSESPFRTVAADGALVLSNDDGKGGFGTIQVSSTAATKTATFNWSTPTDTAGGPKFVIFCTARSGGQYNIACTYLGNAGTLVIDAALERPEFHYAGGVLYCIGLGGATHS